MTQKQPYQLEVKIKELKKTPNHDAQILAFLRELRARRKQEIIYHPRLFYTIATQIALSRGAKLEDFDQKTLINELVFT